MTLSYKDASGLTQRTALLVPDEQRRDKRVVQVIYDAQRPDRATLATGSPGMFIRYMLALVTLGSALLYAFLPAFVVIGGIKRLRARLGR